MIYNLQLLRAFAAISVVFLHVTSDAGLNMNLGVGGYGVDLFFVISGFTIAYIGHMPAGRFFIRRCIRILPLYWGATLAVFIISWTAPGLMQRASADTALLLYSLAFIPHPNQFGEIEPTLPLGWTLNYEMYFYAVFAIGLALARRNAAVVASLLLLTVTFAIRLAGFKNSTAVFYSDPVVYEFLFGIGVYYAVIALQSSFKIRPRRGMLVASSCVAAFVLLSQEKFMPGSRVVFAGVPAAVLVFSLIAIEQKYNVAVSAKWLVLLGDASYVLYLTHPFVVYGFIRLCMRPSQIGRLPLMLAALGLTLLASVAAIAIHIAFEKPILTFLRGRFSPGHAAPVAALT